jgi:deltex-like protein
MTSNIKMKKKSRTHQKTSGPSSKSHPPLKKDLENPILQKQILHLESLEKSLTRPLEKIVKFSTFSFTDFLQLLNNNHEDEKCSICLCEFSESDSGNIIKLEKCSGHYFHKDCIEMCHERIHLRCPVCNTIYGVMTGDMPKGSMIVIRYPSSFAVCEGFENDDVLEIQYEFRSFMKDNVYIPGTHRIAYLPYNEKGLEVLRLLVLAFERRLMFTIGTSVTTGRQNQIIWNGIHHKTSLSGGSSQFGFPDDTYFNRVKEELAAKGIL